MTRLSKRGFVEGRPKKFTDPVKLDKKIKAFFKECDDKVKVYKGDKGLTKIVYEPYTLTGLHLYLDCDDETFNSYENDDVFRPIIKRAKKTVENWVEKKSLTGDINATTAIFNLKNNFGWVDRREIETADVTKEKYESWLKENREALKDVTPEVKQLEQKSQKSEPL